MGAFHLAVTKYPMPASCLMLTTRNGTNNCVECIRGDKRMSHNQAAVYGASSADGSAILTLQQGVNDDDRLCAYTYDNSSENRAYKQDYKKVFVST